MSYAFFCAQDRPDLIKSELAGLAFDSLQQVFRKGDIELMFNSEPLPLVQDQTIWIVIDPAAGGPSSDYAVVSIVRQRGTVTVSAHAIQYASLHAFTKSCTDCEEQKYVVTSSLRRSCRNRPILTLFASSMHSMCAFSDASMFSRR